MTKSQKSKQTIKRITPYYILKQMKAQKCEILNAIHYMIEKEILSHYSTAHLNKQNSNSLLKLITPQLYGKLVELIANNRNENDPKKLEESLSKFYSEFSKFSSNDILKAIKTSNISLSFLSKRKNDIIMNLLRSSHYETILNLLRKMKNESSSCASDKDTSNINDVSSSSCCTSSSESNNNTSISTSDVIETSCSN